jgi:hypothetical protein
MGTTTHHVTQKNKSTWIFPETINFEQASGHITYFYRKLPLKYAFFDLSATKNIHTSFIGFLINIKHVLEKNGGIFTIHPSPEVKKILTHLNLMSYFSSSMLTSKAQKTA